jgi:hypothetical protein
MTNGDLEQLEEFSRQFNERGLDGDKAAWVLSKVPELVRNTRTLNWIKQTVPGYSEGGHLQTKT